MINKNVLLVCIVVALAGLNNARAQAPAPGENTISIEVIARNGADKEKHRFSQDGVVPPFVVRPNQTVPVTLQFPTTTAGMPVAATPLDGGRIAGGDNGVVLPTGRWLFSFSPGAMFGRYRVTVYTPGQQYALEFYVADRDHSPWQQRPGSSH
jgi:hypothetical protein